MKNKNIRMHTFGKVSRFFIIMKEDAINEIEEKIGKLKIKIL